MSEYTIVFKQLRKEALEWWNALSDQSKEKYFNQWSQSKEGRSMKHLTGREIQEIYSSLVLPTVC